MATYVLVHGAWHGGWCYDRVAARLRAAGYTVFQPTSRGLCERAHLLTEDINLSTHVEELAQLLRDEDLHDVVLVGHSYGGMVITGAADREAGRIAALVYLDAFVPNDGDSLASSLPSERAAAMAHLVDPERPGLMAPVPAAAFGLAGDDARWVDGLCTPQPLATFAEPIALTGRIAAITDRTYVLAQAWADQGGPMRAVVERLRADPAWKVIVFPGHHEVMIEDVERTTAVLLAKAAARSAQAA